MGAAVALLPPRAGRAERCSSAGDRTRDQPRSREIRARRQARSSTLAPPPPPPPTLRGLGLRLAASRAPFPEPSLGAFLSGEARPAPPARRLRRRAPPRPRRRRRAARPAAPHRCARAGDAQAARRRGPPAARLDRQGDRRTPREGRAGVRPRVAGGAVRGALLARAHAKLPQPRFSARAARPDSHDGARQRLAPLLGLPER